MQVDWVVLHINLIFSRSNESVIPGVVNGLIVTNVFQDATIRNISSYIMIMFSVIYIQNSMDMSYLK